MLTGANNSDTRVNRPAVRPARLPGEDIEVLPGIRWGRPECLFTPAYWRSQAEFHATELRRAASRIGETLVEEVAACILGGYGVPAEMGLAAFRAVRDSGLLDERTPDPQELTLLLMQPMHVSGKLARYRFARLRASYVAEAVRQVHAWHLHPECHKAFRNRLMQVKGIGPKTASWITRNWLDSDEVAILDVHVVRAGRIMGLYSASAAPQAQYIELETAFLRLAGAIGVRPSRLDALIWHQMRFAAAVGIKALNRLQEHRQGIC